MKRTDTKKTANLLGWSEKEFRSAFKELKSIDSVLDLEEVIRFCTENKDIDSRWNLFIDHYLEEIRILIVKKKKELAEIISNLLLEDAPFKILALFNNIQAGLVEADKNKNKSFIYWKSKLSPIYNIQEGNIEDITYLRYFGDITNNILIENHFRNKFPKEYFNKNLPLLYTQNLQYSFIEILLMDVGDYGDMEDLLFTIISNTGLLGFNIEILRDMTREIWLNPYLDKNKNSISEIISSFNQFQRENITKKKEARYWLYYTATEKLRETKGLGLRESFRKLGQHLYPTEKTIHRRYYERKKIARERNLKVDEIIRMYKLQNELNNIIIAIDMM